MSRLSLLAAALLGLAQPALAQTDVLYVFSPGGTTDKSMRAHVYEPFTKATGIRVVIEEANNSLAATRVKGMVAANNVTVDIFQANEAPAASEAYRAMTEDLTSVCEKVKENKDLLPNACSATGVMFYSSGTLLVYNAAKFPDATKAPKTWADMWEVKAFPGPRSFPNINDQWKVLAAALMADGVAPKDLFPLDLDRAFKKMDQLKPSIAYWWRNGDQSTQGFRNVEFVIGQLWQTRASALKSEGQPIAWSLQQAFVAGDRLQVVKGAPNKANALKFLEFYLSNVEGQTNLCNELSCLPPSRTAAGRMSAEVRTVIPTDPIQTNVEWLNANQAKIQDRWNAWISQ